MSTQIRHGDVLFIRTGDAPAPSETARARQIVVAEGELTGHAHRVHGVGARLAGDVLTLPAGGRITHEEHRELVLVPGMYEVRRQNEWIEVGGSSRSRQVRD